jgi:hypothetical protein
MKNETASKRIFVFSKGLIYDLGDCTKWEYLLPSNEKPLLTVPNRMNENDDVIDDEKEEVNRIVVQYFVSHPTAYLLRTRQLVFLKIFNKNSRKTSKKLKNTWIYRHHGSCLLKSHQKVDGTSERFPSFSRFSNHISFKEFKKRCPEGKKVVFYKKCKVEKFAPYSLKDNLVLKISEYSDTERKLDCSIRLLSDMRCAQLLFLSK